MTENECMTHQRANAIKLAASLVERLKELYVPPTAAEFRDYFGKSYTGICNDCGSVLCSPRGVKIVPEGEEGMDLTWSKFIKFCHENGLIKEEPAPCNPEPARNAAAAVTAAAPAATPTAETSTISVSAEDAEASTLKPSSPDVQTPLSAPASPADVGAATQSLSAAVPASLEAQPSASSAFDYSGLDLPTVDTLHWAEREICDARRDYVARLAQAVYIAHDALCGGGCDNLSQAHNNGGVVHNVDDCGVVANCDNSKHGHRGEDAFRHWCTSVGLGKDTAYRLLQVAALLNGATPEEQAVLEAAGPSLLYAAAKPSAPAELVQAVKDGDITTHKQYQELLAQLKAKEAELASVQHEAELDRKEQEDANAAAMRYKAEAERRAADQQRLEGRVQNLTDALNASRQEAQTSAARVRELEARPIEVRGADPDDIAHWQAEGAKEARAELDKARQEVAALQDRLEEMEAKQDGGDAVALSRQIAASVETILQGHFEVLDTLPYDTYETAVAPFVTLLNRLTTALDLGRWPKKN